MQGVGEKVESPGCHHLGIELTQGAGTGVAGVREEGLSPLFAFAVDGGKRSVGDEGFAPHLKPCGWFLELKPQWH